MISNLKAEDLISFEDEVIERFKNKEILAPVHLYSGNEEQMIRIFQEIRKEDWVFCTWRSHYPALLKGIPRNEVMKEILAGHSISLNFSKYNFVSSAIVTGTLPIAVGVALDIKLKSRDNKVYCFMGDMTSETGAAHECIKYSHNNGLPIVFIIEDNGHSVCTNTRKTWKSDKLTYEKMNYNNVIYYKYESKYPHAGVGERIQF